MTFRHVFLSLGLVLAGGLAHSARADGPPTVPVASQCATVVARAVYQGYGYTHLVELMNRCDRAVVCRVWTNVDPERHRLEAKPGETVSIATRKGSPSREVAASSDCAFSP